MYMGSLWWAVDGVAWISQIRTINVGGDQRINADAVETAYVARAAYGRIELRPAWRWASGDEFMPTVPLTLVAVRFHINSDARQASKVSACTVEVDWDSAINFIPIPLRTQLLSLPLAVLRPRAICSDDGASYKSKHCNHDVTRKCHTKSPDADDDPKRNAARIRVA